MIDIKTSQAKLSSSLRKTMQSVRASLLKTDGITVMVVSLPVLMLTSVGFGYHTLNTAGNIQYLDADTEIRASSIEQVVDIPVHEDNDVVLKIGVPKDYFAASVIDPSDVSEFEIEPAGKYADYNVEISLAEVENTRKELDRIAEEEFRAEMRRQYEQQEKERLEREQKEKEEAELAMKNSQHGTVYDVPNVRSEFKTYMSYKAITSTGTPQYKLQHNENTSTDENGFRKYNGEYMVALGSYYGTDIGTRYRITLDSGNSFYAVLGDQKSDLHTDAKHQHRNGNVVEFIVDTAKISNKCRTSGNMSFANNAGLEGKVVAIERLG